MLCVIDDAVDINCPDEHQRQDTLHRAHTDIKESKCRLPYLVNN